MEPLVKDIMVPTGRFAKISDTATFSGAVMALERAHDDFMAGKREQITLLVTDAEGTVTGKLSRQDLVRGMTAFNAKNAGGGFEGLFLVDELRAETMTDKAVLWAFPLEEKCELAKDREIRNFIPAPDASEIIAPEQIINDALYRFAHYGHEFLFVMEGRLLVGILRFDDMYRIVAKLTKSACGI